MNPKLNSKFKIFIQINKSHNNFDQKSDII